MIYKKPQLPWGYNALCAFIESLPDEFEIVQPGMTQVKWPEECTKDAMNRAARYLSYNAGNTEGAAKHMLFVLAAIAPEKPKKRKLCVWAIGGDLIVKPSDWAPREHELWRKVGGPFEVEA